MSSTFLPRQWRPTLLILTNLAAILLLASWQWTPSREFWDALDLIVFRLLNNPVKDAGLWAHIWAIGSMRPVDLGVGLLMLTTMIKSGLIFPAARIRRAFLAFLVILALMLIVRVVFTDMVEATGWQRSSPSLVLEDTARMSEMFPGWEERWNMKDHASRSFPGDHASVLMIWAFFLSFFTRGWRLLMVWSAAILFMLPRLVAGAHWLSDALVGGLFLNLIGLSWGLCTPFAHWASGWLEKLTLPLTIRFRSIPILGRLHIIRSD